MKKSPASDPYEECIVSFIDILGFKEMVKRRPATEIIKIIRILRNSTASDTTTASEKKMKYVRLQSEAFVENISDAVVRIRTKDTQYRSGALAWEILDLIHAQMDCIANGVLIRAGVTVGLIHIGLDGKGPIFGPALIRAYELEEGEVVYPRIAVEDHVFERLRVDKAMWRDGHTLQDELDFLDRVLATDEAGLRYIDYLRASEGESDSQSSYFEFLHAHKKIIDSGLAENTPPKVKRKYQWLQRYHNNHIHPIIKGLNKSEKRRNAFFEEYEVDAVSYFEDLLVQ